MSEDTSRTPLTRALDLLKSDPSAQRAVRDLIDEIGAYRANGESQSEEAQALQMEIAKQAVALQELQSITEQQRVELDEVERAHGELLAAVALQSHTILAICSSHTRGGLVAGLPAGVPRETDQR